MGLDFFTEIPAPNQLPAPMTSVPRTRWMDVFWREPPPGGSRVDDMVFQIRRDLAALEDGPDAFLEERVAQYRACVVELVDEL